MTRICITGGPRTGKTTLANAMANDRERASNRAGECHGPALHTDDLMHLGWSTASLYVAECWLNEPGPWIIEGVAVSRALRKWREQNPSEPPPVDRVIYLDTPHEPLSKGHESMAKGVRKVHDEIEGWLEEHNIKTEYR